MDADSEAIIRGLGLWEERPSIVEQLEDMASWKRVVGQHGRAALRELADGIEADARPTWQ